MSENDKREPTNGQKEASLRRASWRLLQRVGLTTALLGVTMFGTGCSTMTTNRGGYDPLAEADHRQRISAVKDPELQAKVPNRKIFSYNSGSGFGTSSDGPILTGLTEMFVQVGKTTGVDPHFLVALAMQKSSVNPYDIAPDGSAGLYHYSAQSFNQIGRHYAEQLDKLGYPHVDVTRATEGTEQDPRLHPIKSALYTALMFREVGNYIGSLDGRDLLISHIAGAEIGRSIAQAAKKNAWMPIEQALTQDQIDEILSDRDMTRVFNHKSVYMLRQWAGHQIEGLTMAAAKQKADLKRQLTTADQQLSGRDPRRSTMFGRLGYGMINARQDRHRIRTPFGNIDYGTPDITFRNPAKDWKSRLGIDRAQRDWKRSWNRGWFRSR